MFLNVPLRGPRVAILAAVAALAVAGCGGSDSDDTAGTTTPAPAATAPQATDATPTPTSGKKAKKKGKKGAGKGNGTGAEGTGNDGETAVAPELTVLPTVTTNPNLDKVAVTVTTDGVSLSPASLPAGHGMMFNIRGQGKFGKRAQLTFTSGGEVVGIARILNEVVHMETRSLVAGKLEIVVSGTNRVRQKRKLVPVS